MNSDQKLLEALTATIQLKHKCKAVHRDSNEVEEHFEGQLVWQGCVEVFKITGHKKASKCFAWANIINENHREFVTILQSGLVASPEMAVKAWLATRFKISPVVTEKKAALRVRPVNSVDMPRAG